MSRLGLAACAALTSLYWAAPAEAAKAPRIFQSDGNDLARVKEQAAKDVQLKAAVEALRKQADEALSAGPFTVVRPKPVPAPSGDKHDYVSLAPYWWPDPAKKDGKPYVRRDGRVNPEREKYDRPQLGGLADAVGTLALAYYLTGEEKYAARAATLLRTWFLDKATRMSPHLKYGQFVPGRNEGRAAGIIDTVRLLPVVDAVGMLEGSRHWTKDDQAGLRAWFRDYLHWLRTSKEGKDEAAATNNHGTWYDVQVATFALLVGDEAAARAVLEQSKAKRIARQVEPDGRQPRELTRTKSFGYSVVNLRGLFALATLGDRLGVDLWRYRSADGRSMRQALDWLLPYATGEKKWAHKQIGKPPVGAVAVLLRRAAVAYKDRRYEQARERLPGKGRTDAALTLLYPPAR
jgi:hypothetical protein